MDPVATTLVILGLAVVALMSNRIPMAVVAIGVALSLWATGILSLEQALAGFGDPVVLFIASLFVVGEALDATGVTTWVAQRVVGAAGTSRPRLLLAVMVLSALLTALISVNGAVAALIPLVVVVAVRLGLSPSRLLLPLAFAAHAGSMLALTGTPVNILVSQTADDVGAGPFGFFEFALVGIPLVIGTLAITMAWGDRLIPERTPVGIGADLSGHQHLLAREYGLTEGHEPLLGSLNGVTEVVVPPRSDLVGLHVEPGMVTPHGDLVVLGARRGGSALRGSHARLEVGDSLLLAGTWSDLEQHTAGPDVLVVDSPRALRRTVPFGRGARRAVVILVVMIALTVGGVVPATVAAMLAAGAMVITRVLDVDDAFRSISMTTVVLVAGMIPLSTAFTTTGAADRVAELLLDALGGADPRWALLVLCLATMALGQLISNMATVLIVIPVALAVADDFAVSPLPFLMALSVAGAAAFLTPIATPANTMVFGPGGLRFGDYWRLGLPLLLLFLLVAVFYVPWVWSF